MDPTLDHRTTLLFPAIYIILETLKSSSMKFRHYWFYYLDLYLSSCDMSKCLKQKGSLYE